jgi:hypothetical protein
MLNPNTVMLQSSFLLQFQQIFNKSFCLFAVKFRITKVVNFLLGNKEVIHNGTGIDIL